VLTLGSARGAVRLVASSPAAAEPACSRLAAPITDHSCFHARLGPFKDVIASAPAQQHVDEVHTYYAVSLPAPRRVGSLFYRPARTGRWAFYLQHPVPLEVRDASGSLLPASHTDEVPGCPFLAHVEVMSLVAGTEYRISLGPTTASQVGLVIENLDDFVVVHGRDRDGDGYGSASEIQVSPCLPEMGWVADDEDCDDVNPQVHPGSAELCGQADRNCNGVDGDGGASCQRGVGACGSRGIFACTEDGVAPVCSAIALQPSAERCNGLDDDCDGSSDEIEPGLCLDAELPRCVADGRGGAACGCDRDADCGAADSARLCWLRGTEQRCIAGCVDGFGRNSCPTGERCTSADPEMPGACVPAGAEQEGSCGCQSGSPSVAGWSAGVWIVFLLLRRRRSRHSNARAV
jgi:Putative metal-binding motif